MSKSLPQVSIATVPLASASHSNHTEEPPKSSGWTGSPASSVASAFVPVAVAGMPAAGVVGAGSAKSSFAGGAASAGAARQKKAATPAAEASPFALPCLP